VVIHDDLSLLVNTESSFTRSYYQFTCSLWTELKEFNFYNLLGYSINILVLKHLSMNPADNQSVFFIIRLQKLCDSFTDAEN